ncbi:MAG: dephospho-CoA kinase [Acidobacteria bacterium]|nr:dephospho-CoA kinase [Acidobacteriota bacterium]
MCTVGLTGGLASGKSTVARLLAARGARVIDADTLVHELYRPGEPGAAAVRTLFGAAALTVDGSVDREALARFVLGDPGSLGRLNAAIHPLVRRRVAAWLDGLSACHHDETVVAVIEAALLVETGGFSSYDLLAVVWCRPEQQLERAIARGMPEAHARALLDAQAPLDEKRAVADIVIDNSGDRGALDAEVDRSWTEILARCRTLRG